MVGRLHVGMVGCLHVGIAGCQSGGMSELRDVGRGGCRTGGMLEWVLPPQTITPQCSPCFHHHTYKYSNIGLTFTLYLALMEGK